MTLPKYIFLPRRSRDLGMNDTETEGEGQSSTPKTGVKNHSGES